MLMLLIELLLFLYINFNFFITSKQFNTIFIKNKKIRKIINN